MNQIRKKQAFFSLAMILTGMMLAYMAQHYIPKETPLTQSTVLPPHEVVNPVIAPVSSNHLHRRTERPDSWSVWVPSVVQLNSAYFYPEGTDETDPFNSIAGLAYRKLVMLDQEWIAEIYDKAKINTWEKINLMIHDGDGNPIQETSNLKNIISMASVYTYYEDIKSEQTFYDYVEQLWNLSHTYQMNPGEVYYCEGCRNQENGQAVSNSQVPLASSSQVPLASSSQILLADSSQVPLASSSQISVSADQVSCPGHIDLNIEVEIIGTAETHNLFNQDETGNTESKKWQGWNLKTQSYVEKLDSQNWEKRYQLPIPSAIYRAPLTGSEIAGYMGGLPQGLSQSRKDIIQFALSTVGTIPYYWGGKASAPLYEGNGFGTIVKADDHGRILRGLDCSGWINWVYWSVTGKPLNKQSTSGLISCGTGISEQELLPGDIMVRTGENAHVVMFLGWKSDGKIICIHETGGSVDNVTISETDANWNYYRKLVNEE